jgi:outer membrane biosynthesis protein TonB
VVFCCCSLASEEEVKGEAQGCVATRSQFAHSLLTAVVLPSAALCQVEEKPAKKAEKPAKKEKKPEKKVEKTQKSKKKSKGSESESDSDLGSEAAEEGSDPDADEVDQSLILTTSRRSRAAPVSYKDMLGDEEDDDDE